MMHKASDSYNEKLDQNLDPSKNRKKPKKLDQNLDQFRTKSTIPFTDLGIKNLKALDKRKIYWRNGLPDFGVRVSPNGNKTWIYEYRFGNKTRRMGLGRYPIVSLAKATQLYFKAQNKILEGIDPLQERQKTKKAHNEELTVRELIDIYIGFCKSSGEKCYKEKQRGSTR